MASHLNDKVLSALKGVGYVPKVRRLSDGALLEVRGINDDQERIILADLDGLALNVEVHSTSCGCNNKEYVVEDDEAARIAKVLVYGKTKKEFNTLTAAKDAIFKSIENQNSDTAETIKVGDFAITNMFTGNVHGQNPAMLVLVLGVYEENAVKMITAVAMNSPLEFDVLQCPAFSFRKIQPGEMDSLANYLDAGDDKITH